MTANNTHRVTDLYNNKNKVLKFSLVCFGFRGNSLVLSNRECHGRYSKCLVLVLWYTNHTLVTEESCL